MAEDFHAEFSGNIAGRIYSFVIRCEKSVVKDICVTAVTLYGIYKTHKLLAQAIDGIVNRGLGGPRQDQGTCLRWPFNKYKTFFLVQFFKLYLNVM